MTREGRWWRLATAATASALLGTVMAACSSCAESREGQLSDSTGGTSSWSISIRDTAVDDSYSFGNINLCVKKGSSVRVVAVTPVHASGDPIVRAFAVRKIPPPDVGLFGDSKGTLEQLGRGVGGDGAAEGFDPAADQVVAGSCSRELGQSEMAIELARNTQATAVVDGLRVTYEATDGIRTHRTSTFVAPGTFLLCSSDDPRLECRP